eukprot:1288146-Rhodomonas_salina.1
MQSFLGKNFRDSRDRSPCRRTGARAEESQGRREGRRARRRESASALTQGARPWVHGTRALVLGIRMAYWSVSTAIGMAYWFACTGIRMAYWCLSTGRGMSCPRAGTPEVL